MPGGIATDRQLYMDSDEIRLEMVQSVQDHGSTQHLLGTNIMFSGLLINIRSLMSKVTDLNLMLDMYKPSVVLLTETWLKPHVPDSFFIDCDKYTVFRRDRINGVGGGGVCCY